MEACQTKYLTFTLGDKQYGIPVASIKQITGMAGITQVPTVPRTIKGFINIKGKIIPVMDLRLKLKLEEKPLTDRTYVIVVKTKVEGVKKQIGITVDEVSEVVNIQGEESLQTSENEICGEKTGRVQDKDILFLDIENLLNTEEINILKQT